MKDFLKISFKTEIIPIIFLIALVISSFYFYSVFPEQVPMHWNFEGEVDSYGPKTLGAFLIPVIVLIMYFMFLVLPYADPRKEKYALFSKSYFVIRSLMVIFMSVIYFLTSLAAVGYPIEIGLWIPILIGLLFIVIGNYLGKVKSNWFVGIKTPWTLSSDENWNKTHRFGGRIFVLSGILFILTPFLPVCLQRWMFFFVVVLILTGSIGYSFLLYIKEKNNK